MYICNWVNRACRYCCRGIVITRLGIIAHCMKSYVCLLVILQIEPVDVPAGFLWHPEATLFAVLDRTAASPGEGIICTPHCFQLQTLCCLFVFAIDLLP